MKVRISAVRLSLILFAPTLLIVALAASSFVIDYGSLALEFYLFLTLAYIAPIIVGFYYIVARLGGSGGSLTSNHMMGNNFSLRFRYFIYCLSLIFILSSVVEYIWFGSVLQLGITDARYDRALSSGSGGGIGFLILLTSGAPAMLGVIILEMQRKLNAVTWPAVLIFILALLALFLSGGRNGFLITLLYVFCYILLCKIRSPQYKFLRSYLLSIFYSVFKPKYLFVVMSLGFLVFYSFLMFGERAALREEDVFVRLMIFEMEYGLNLPALDGGSSEVSSVTALFIYFYFYFTHSVFSLYELFITSADGFAYGSYSFNIFFKVAESFGIVDTNELLEVVPTLGLYYGLLGSLVIDFGTLYGVIFFNFIYLISLILISKAINHPRFTFLAAYFMLVIILSPLYSVFTISNGFSLFLISLLSIFFVKRPLK